MTMEEQSQEFAAKHRDSYVTINTKEGYVYFLTYFTDSDDVGIYDDREVFDDMELPITDAQNLLVAAVDAFRRADLLPEELKKSLTDV